MIVNIVRELLEKKYAGYSVELIPNNLTMSEKEHTLCTLFDEIERTNTERNQLKRAFFWNDDPDSYMADRIQTARNEDLFVQYVEFLVEDYFNFDEQALIKNIRREYAKIFCDINNVTRMQISSLEGRSGILYKALSNDLSIEISQNCCKDDEIRIFVEKNQQLSAYLFPINDLYYVLFYFSVINKSWRAKYYGSCEYVTNNGNIVDEIKMLDDGATSVFIVNKEGKYLGNKYLADYVSLFPSNIPLHRDYVEIMTEEEMVEYSMFKILRYYNESIPCLNEERIEGFIKKRDEGRFHVELRWDLISTDVIVESLEEYNNIILSSLNGGLNSIYERIKNVKKVSVLNEANYFDLLNGKYDLIITNSDIWGNIPVNSMNIKQLYINLYCIQMKGYFDEKGVEYSFYCIPDSERIINHRKRVAEESRQHVNNIMEDWGTYTVADGIIDGCEYFHGRRKTTNTPMIWERTIYFFGPCISIGVFALDAETIESSLQRLLNENGMKFRVVNVPAPLLLNPYDSSINTLHKIGKEKYRKGDIIIHFGRNNLEWHGLIKEDQVKHDLSDVFNYRENITKKCFIGNMAAHINTIGYKMIADYIFDEIRKHNEPCKQKSEFWQFHPEDDEKIRPELEKYIKYLHQNEFENVEGKVVGAVAVNANPFTLGHAYLIEEARKKSDYLYVFVAEEDLSDFSFEVRFELVSAYCKQYSDVKVIPSGRFFASTLSFGDYFNRDALSEVRIDATMDCNIFAKVIAKELKISFRILGEEKTDIVTHQYNQFVKEILEQNGVKVYIIPRLEINSVTISAKNVRKHIALKEYELLKDEVPETTYRYILEHT